MALPSIGGGQQLNDGNLNEIVLGTQATPATATVTATLTIAQLITGILNASPGATAASYTLPTVALTEATLVNVKVGSAFDFSVCNIDGNASGVITMVAGTGWTIVGLATIAAVAGTTGRFRAWKTGATTWTLQRLS